MASSDPEKLKHELDFESSKPPTTTQTQIYQGTITDALVVGKDGFALFPQPVQSDPLDPLNWSSIQKHSILSIIMALVRPIPHPHRLPKH